MRFLRGIGFRLCVGSGFRVVLWFSGPASGVYPQ